MGRKFACDLKIEKLRSVDGRFYMLDEIKEVLYFVEPVFDKPADEEALKIEMFSVHILLKVVVKL